MINLSTGRQEDKVSRGNKDIVRIIKQADYWGSDQVITIISKQPTNLERTHKLEQLLRGAYQASKYRAHKAGAIGQSGVCVMSD